MRRICGIFKNNTSTEFKIQKLKLIKDNKLSKTFTIIPQQNMTKQYLNIYIFILKSHPMIILVLYLKLEVLCEYHINYNPNIQR